MPVKAKRNKLTVKQREKELKKLFGPDFREPTDAEYARARMVELPELFAELGVDVPTLDPRERVLHDVKLQVKQLRKHLSQLDKQLKKL